VIGLRVRSSVTGRRLPSKLACTGRESAPSEHQQPVEDIAVARRLAVIMHGMWLDGTDFRWQREPDAPAGAAA